MSGSRFHIDDLTEAFGLRRQTIHHYVREGLLPPPEGKTRSARYTMVHWQRLKDIQKAREQRVTLKDLKDRYS